MDLIIENISRTFPGERGLFGRAAQERTRSNGRTSGCAAGESLGIVGESGSGNTTLSKILAGFFPADEGTARLGDLDLLMTLSRAER